MYIQNVYIKVITFKKSIINVYLLLFQNEFVIRVIVVSIFQIWPIFYASYFAYKLLKRGKNRSTYTLSGFFILTALTYFLATLSTFLVPTPLSVFSYAIYVLSIYTLIFSYAFLINFSWLLTRLDENPSPTKYYLRIILYAILSLYVLVIAIPFNGITLNATTGWIPIYSWFFLGFSWTYIIIFFIIPQIYFSLKIMKKYAGIVLKKRLNLFLLSVFLGLTIPIFVFLYHAMPGNVILRTSYILTMPEIGIIAAYLIYNGFGKELDK
ncbi:MAG: hypothetical protein ACTSQU_03415 [Promethearchaeota archaeon]